MHIASDVTCRWLMGRLLVPASITMHCGDKVQSQTRIANVVERVFSHRNHVLLRHSAQKCSQAHTAALVERILSHIACA